MVSQAHSAYVLTHRSSQGDIEVASVLVSAGRWSYDDAQRGAHTAHVKVDSALPLESWRDETRYGECTLHQVR